MSTATAPAELSRYAYAAAAPAADKIDAEAGTMRDVSILSIGPALGHDSFVDEDSLDTALVELRGERLPAYITHRGALWDDRLTREIGMFDSFRVEGDQLFANFTAFDSFREDDTRKFKRLFELAQKMPERFGLSIVFSGRRVWATKGGDLPLNDDESRPDAAIYEFPSIRINAVSSADFVDQPAANARGLFAQIDTPTNSMKSKQEIIDENTNLAEQVADLKEKLSKAPAGDSEKDAEALEALTAEKDQLSAELEGTKEKLEASEKAAGKLQTKLDASETELAALRKAIKGSKAVEVSVTQEENPEKKIYSDAERTQVIAEYAKREGIDLFTAGVRLSRERPELWNKPEAK